VFPDHGVGAVILTNGDWGYALRGPLLRRIAELMFDGKPEAQARIDASAAQLRAAHRKARERFVIPPDAALAGKLAPHYASKELGAIDVRHEGAKVVFDVGEWKSSMASRLNDDGTVSFFTVDPGLFDGFEFVVAEKDRKRALITRDGQHEYFFIE
jgi:hypothetical protein